MKTNRRAFALLTFLGVLLVPFLTGCQTSKGLGKDVEKLGEKIQDKAK